MENFHQVNSHRNPSNKANGPVIPKRFAGAKTGPTFYRKVGPKRYIILTQQQVCEVKRLYEDSKTLKPGWVRRKFAINQRRRKELNNILFEAGCDDSICGKVAPENDWSYQLHIVWHLINEKLICQQ